LNHFAVANWLVFDAFHQPAQTLPQMRFLQLPLRNSSRGFPAHCHCERRNHPDRGGNFARARSEISGRL